MKDNPVLTPNQQLFLELLGKSRLSDKFYLSGGTALVGFYIPYRYSEDLDFFSFEEVQVDEVIAFIRSNKEILAFKSFDFNTSFNRNLFFLRFPSETFKLEFTFYPFPQINKPMQKRGVKIDSIEDIGVNKLFTIYQNPRSRDFMDLYMIIKKCDFTLKELLKKAKIKFDWHIDALKLGSQLLLSASLKDYPNLMTPIDEREWQDFFKDEAKKLEKDILDTN